MQDESPRSTALDPDLLTAEISLLLDYLSGLSGRSLASGSRGRLPTGSDSYEKALTRYFEIDHHVRHHEPITPSDLQFLLEMRDYLNGQAEPATGSTIAFTTLVIRKKPEARKGMAEAERAYPEWVPMANALRSTMFALQAMAVTFTIMVAVLAAYIYFGSSMLANLASVQGQIKTVIEEISKHEQSEPIKLADGFARYCGAIDLVPDPNDPNSKMQRFRTTVQAHVCDRKDDAFRKQDLAYESLSIWFPHDDRRLEAWLAMLKGYALPMLMGLLGSMAYVLRRYLRSIGERLLNPRDLREYIVRIVLGSLCGVVIGLFTISGGEGASVGTSGALSRALGAPALAFLAGYGVEVVFRMLDGLSETVFPARK